MKKMAALKQIEIDWENVIHVRENSAQNEAHLNANRYHFTGQAAVVKTWLDKGLKVTSAFANQNNITDLQRRIGDLGEFGGIDIDRDYMMKKGKKTRMLVYFLPERRIEFTKRGIIPLNDRWWYSDKYTPQEVINKIKESKKQ